MNFNNNNENNYRLGLRIYWLLLILIILHIIDNNFNRRQYNCYTGVRKLIRTLDEKSRNCTSIFYSIGTEKKCNSSYLRNY